MTTEKKPGYVFNASVQIGQATALTITGNIPEGATTEQIVEETEKVLKALDKHNARRMKLPAVKGALKDQKVALERAKDQFEKLKAKEQSGEKLNSGEKAQFQTCQQQIEKIAEQVEDGEAILAEVEKEAA